MIEHPLEAAPPLDNSLDSPGILQDHQALRQKASFTVLRLAQLADDDRGTVMYQKRPMKRGRLLREVADKLEKNEFVLAVVGEFSRGKSTLINALLGQPDLLPTAIEPSTAAVTVVTYGPDLDISVTFEDGRTHENLNLEDLARYTLGQDLDGRTRRDDLTRRVAAVEQAGKLELLSSSEIDLGALAPPPPPAPPLRRVRTVNVKMPSPLLRDGVCLVDTPGIGSVNPQHGAATRDFIQRADAVVFLINTDPVISASECNFLAFLKDYVNRFLFAVTKIDRYTPRERQQSVDYTRRVIHESAGLANPPIYPVSARLAQDARPKRDEAKYAASGFPEFLHGLEVFLIRARGQEFIQKQLAVAQAQLQALRNTTLVELESLEMSLDVLPQRIEAAREALAQADAQRQEILRELDRDVRRVHGVMEGFSPLAKMRLELALHTEIEREVDGYDWNQLQRASETIPICIRDLLQIKLAEQFRAVSRQLEMLRENTVMACQEHAGEFNQKLGAQFKGLQVPERINFSLNFDAAEFSERLWKIGTLTIGYTVVLTVAGFMAAGPLGALVLVGGIVARTTIASLLRSRVKGELKAALGPSLARLVGELFDNVRKEVQESTQVFRGEVESYLHNASADIEDTLNRLEQDRPRDSSACDERRQQLRIRLAELEQLDSDMSLIAGPSW